MRFNRSNPAAWFLLIVFSIQAITPGFNGLLLCFGCDQSGFALRSIQTATSAASAEACCSVYPERSGTTHDDDGDLVAEEPFAPCDCVRVDLHGDDTVHMVPPHGSNEPVQVSMLPACASVTAAVALYGTVSERGPPDTPEARVGRTLFGQRALLTI